MPEIVLNTEDLTIFAPPDNIDVQVDIGPQGIRGNKFFVGAGNPNSATITVDGEIAGEEILFGDIYVNVSPGDSYGYIYQYIAEPGGNTWVQVLDINPVIYSKIYTTTFTAGDATIVIPISDIIFASSTPLTVDSFNVKYSIENQYPIASSMELSATSTDLSVTLHAIKYSSSTWSNLTGSVDVHVQITIEAS